MGTLREQMDGDLVVRGMAVRTRDSYLGAVAALAKYYRRRPDRIGEAEVQRYLLYLIEERKLAWSSCNVAAQGLKFFYRVTLKRTEAQFGIRTARQPPREDSSGEHRRQGSITNNVRQGFSCPRPRRVAYPASRNPRYRGGGPPALERKPFCLAVNSETPCLTY